MGEVVRKATKGEYSASIQDVYVNIFTRRLTVSGLEFWPDSTRKVAQQETGKHHIISVKLSVPRFQLDGVALWQLCLRKRLSVDHASIWNGKLLIVSTERIVDSSKIIKSEKQSPTLKQLLAGTIDIVSPDITFKYVGLDEKDRFTTSLKGGKAQLTDWLLDPEKEDTMHLLLAQKVVIDSASVVFDKRSMRYLIKAPNICFNTEQHTLKVNGLGVHPYVNRETFYKEVGHRATIWNTDIEYFELLNFNWLQMLHNQTLWASHLNMSAPKMDLFFSYLIPSHPSNMIAEDPPRVFLQLPLKICLGKINVDKGHIGYTEVNETSHREGTIYFDGIKATGDNLTNIDTVIEGKKQFVASAEGTLLGRSKVNATLTLTLTDLLGNFELKGHAVNISGQELRDPVEALAQVRIDSLNLKSMDLSIKGNQNYSESKLGMNYTDLKLELVRAKAPPTLKAKPVVSEVASLLFLYKQNPEPSIAPRTSSAYMTRDEMAPYLSLIIKNMRIAIKEMVVKHPDLVGTVTNDKDLKSQKRGFLRRVFGKRKSK
ncbi:hypothetical protein CJD36_005045 [Flavipsychrobacter stenotrophus]|uniref:AsmA-like C-terminal domain-containing protein n=1 Tax=Flavipsychrobacter stenotrophus TaxID=2077091 RepID=A0A2S7T2K6_9BACT|nr:hypothetical protein CJD36_005045 [Flavipsychrobacter stenotrophus]